MNQIVEKTYPTLFGERLKGLRQERGYTLRKFCVVADEDPAYISRIERGKLPPPQSIEKLEKIALILELKKGTQEFEDFVNLGIVSAGNIPEETLSDEEALQLLPVLFRTIDGKRLTPEKLEDLIDFIKQM